jgi:hypothetical protein
MRNMTISELVALLYYSAWGSALFWFSGLWAVVWFIRKVSKDADDELDPTKRRFISERLARMHHQNIGSWIPDFTLVFDRFFGRKHLAWRCFYRSSIISIFCFSIFYVLTGIYLEFSGPAPVIFPIFFALAFNVISDYLSLLETRLILNIRIPIPLKIVIDSILTFAISLLWIWVSVYLLAFDHYTTFWSVLNDVLRWFLGHQTGDVPTIMVRIIIGTGYATSIWLWFHGLAHFAIRNLQTFNFVMSWLNVKERPIRAIGTTINIFVLAIGIVLFPVYLLFVN